MLAELINKSVCKGIFPSILKNAYVIPIHKGGNAASTNNYRPISILSNLSKVYEKIVHRQLLNYLNMHDILHPNQYGFRANHTTSQAILTFLQRVYDSLDEGNLYFAIFMDFRKAFDSVSHSILLSKLNSYGIRGIPLSWFRSYLSSRKQHVIVNNQVSEERQVNCGVPQGSILGPLLFLIFINDFPLCSGYFEFILFADDSTLSCTIPRNQINHIHSVINSELENVNNWLKRNKILLNVDKTKYIVFSHTSFYNLPSIQINNTEIECVKSTRFLGLILDHNLRFHEHVNMGSAKISRSLGVFSRINKFLPRTVMILLYYSLIHPCFTYAIEAWFGSPCYVRDKMIMLHKRAVRVITCSDYFAHTAELYRDLKFLNVQSIYRLNVGCHMFKTLTVLLYDPILLNYVNSHTNQHNHSTRTVSNITLPRYNKTKSKSSIIYAASELWNSVDDNLKHHNSIDTFKFHFKSSLLNSQ